MVNPSVDGYTKSPNQRKISENVKRRQPTENQKNTETGIQAKWRPGFYIQPAKGVKITPHPSRQSLKCNKHFKH